MDIYTFREKVEKYTKEVIEDFEKTNKIDSLVKQLSKTNFYLEKHQKNLNKLKQEKPEEYMDNYYPWKGKYSLNNYEKEIKKIESFKGELLQKSGEIRNQKQKEQRDKDYELKTSHCSYCKSKPPTNHYIYSKKSKQLKPTTKNASIWGDKWLFCSEKHFQKWHKKNYFICAECLEENYTGKYKYNKSKKDNQKFCSNNCYYNHYAEKCDNCYEKCISSYQGKATGYAQTYYSDGINKTGVLCSKCHQEKLKEEAEERKKDQEWEERSKRLSKNMDDLVDSMAEAVKKSGEEEDLDDLNINNNNSNLTIERERDNNLLQYFKQHNIQSIKLDNNKLLIKYNHKEEEEEEPNTTELLEIKDYLQKQPTKTITLNDLEQKSKSNSSLGDKDNDKIGLYIGCGVVGIFLIGLVVILVRRNKKP